MTELEYRSKREGIKAPSANPGSGRRYRSCSTHNHGFTLPRRFEICHCLLATLGIAAIVRIGERGRVQEIFGIIFCKIPPAS
jgi:hypothetical protein